MERRCLNCGASFDAKTERARFCSDRCRAAAHYAGRNPVEYAIPTDEVAVRAQEEAYVREQVAITQAQLDAGILKPVEYMGRGRLERAEAYARWRWREYHDGNVASL